MILQSHCWRVVLWTEEPKTPQFSAGDINCPALQAVPSNSANKNEAVHQTSHNKQKTQELFRFLCVFFSSAFSLGIDYSTAKESPNFKDLITTHWLCSMLYLLYCFNIQYKNIIFRKQRKLFEAAPSTVSTWLASVAVWRLHQSRLAHWHHFCPPYL